MEARPVRPLAKDIQKRFFEALNQLMENGTIKRLKHFTGEYGLHEAKYVELRAVYLKGGVSKYNFIDIDAPGYLVRDYGVSGDWLLTGKGNMFRNNHVKSDKIGILCNQTALSFPLK